MDPTVSVVMPVYNGAQYLRDAVDSILGQTFADFEFIVVNDGSSDATPAILNSYRDPRLRIVQNDRNLGVACSLNRGLAEARGRYIARQDADDISLPSRLEQQVKFLDSHPQVVVLGTGATILGSDEPLLRCATDDVEIRWMMLSRNPFVHTSVMMRRSALERAGPYSTDEAHRHCEDYDLWLRLAQVGRLANLEAPLVRWRAHAQSVSRQNLEIQQGRAQAVGAGSTWLLGNVNIDPALWQLWQRFWCPPRDRATPFSADEARRLAAFLPRLVDSFCQQQGLGRAKMEQHRRAAYFSWARHAMALALRPAAGRDVGARLEFGRMALQLLFGAVLLR